MEMAQVTAQGRWFRGVLRVWAWGEAGVFILKSSDSYQ